jgi:hypothetical protein
MLPRVAVPPPYDWLPAALEKFAAKNDLSLSAAGCLLLDRGLRRNLSTVRVLRPFPVARGTSGKSDGTPLLKALSTSAEYSDLPDAIAAALVTLRDQHVERARVAALEVAKVGLSKKTDAARGWRADMDSGDKRVEGVVLQFVSSATLPEAAMVDACDCVTSDMTTADVMRAVWASELEREKLAPKKWADRRMVGVGWLHFQDREVR